MRKLPLPFAARRSVRGVTLIEALVAMLVMSLGLLAFAGLHAKLRLNSDVARQRSEAVRKAQEDMEDLRAFANLAAYGAIASAVQTQAVLATENATYAINRTVDTSTTPQMKRLTVVYSWADRASNAQSVTLRSTIARLDPKLGAQMSLPPNGSPVKDPLGRDVQVPIPAKNLGNGTSVFKPRSGGGVAFVFSNQTGRVTKKCTGLSTSTTTAQLTQSTLDAATCTTIDGLIISGFVRSSLGNSLSISTPTNDAPPGAMTMALTLDQTTIPSGGVGTVEQLESESYWSTPPPSSSYAVESDDCGAEDSISVSFTQSVNFTQVNNGVTQVVTSIVAFAIVPAGTPITAAAIAPYAGLFSTDITNPAATGERFVAYACVVRAVELGGGAKAWTGRLNVVPSGWTIGTTYNNSTQEYRVCRYTADYNRNTYVVQKETSGANPKVLKIDNAEHPESYLHVTTSLSNQNFLIARGNNNCPTDSAVEVDGQGSENFTNETTKNHQPTPAPSD